MSLLSLAPDTPFDLPLVRERSRVATRSRASGLAYAFSLLLIVPTLTVPTAQVHAKRAKLALIVASMQHRGLASLGF